MDDLGDNEVPGESVEVDAVSGRVLGCLIEKAMTTPDHYPMSLNAVMVACNQVSNREPVVDYDESTVERTLRALADEGLARMVHRPGDRVVKYRQALTEALGLTDQEAALLAVLVLRGPQTPGELRQRTARYVDFVSLSELEEALHGLQTRPVPLVERLDRRPGQKEYRYRQLVAREDRPGTVDDVGADAESPGDDPIATPSHSDIEQLRARVDELEQRLGALLAELGLSFTDSVPQDAGDF